VHDMQFPEIVVTGSGGVYVLLREIDAKPGLRHCAGRCRRTAAARSRRPPC
jgi:hypothetical protein